MCYLLCRKWTTAELIYQTMGEIGPYAIIVTARGSACISRHPRNPRRREPLLAPWTDIVPHNAKRKETHAVTRIRGEGEWGPFLHLQ